MASFCFRLPRALAGVPAMLLAVLLLCMPGTAEAAQETRPQGIGPRPPTPTGVVVNLPARTLYWYVDGELVRSFPVGVGRVTAKTPTGSWKVQNKAVHPWWLPPDGGKAVPPGPANPLGTRWIGFNGGYGIHGNNNPASIGGYVSAGCIRMYKEDVEWLYEQVRVGTPVHVIYEPVQVQLDRGGRAYLAIYPDGYGRGGKSAAQVLTAAGLAPDAVKATQPGLYRADAAGVVNGAAVPAILYQSKPYLAARDLGTRLAATVTWDDAARRVVLDGQPVTTTLKGGSGYVDAEEAAAVLGVEYSWNAQNGVVTLTGHPLFLNGHLLSREGRPFGDEVHLPVRAVAEAAGHSVDWDNTARRALVDGTPVPTVLYRSRSFTPVNELAARLGLPFRTSGSAIYLGN